MEVEAGGDIAAGRRVRCCNLRMHDGGYDGSCVGVAALLFCVLRLELDDDVIHCQRGALRHRDALDLGTPTHASLG